MTTEQLIRILVTVTLVEMMTAIGLGVTLADVGRTARNSALLIRAVAANYVCVPLATLALLLWFRPPPMVAAGFLVVAVCPGAAYGPPFTAIARGNVPVAVGLMVLLAGSSTIFAPVLLRLLLPLMTASQALRVDVFEVVTTLLLSQFLPLFVGLAVRQWRPSVALTLKRPADVASTVLNLCTLGFIVVARFEMLAAVRFQAFVGMLALAGATIAAGWLLAERGSENHKAMTFTTSVRNVAVALEIATSSFPGTPAVTAVLVYGLFQTLLMAAVAFGWGRAGSSSRSSATAAA